MTDPADLDPMFAALARRPSRPDLDLLSAYLLGRLVVILAALLAEGGLLIARNPRLVTTESGPIVRSLTTWDAPFYLDIARHGYQAAAVAGYHDIAFFPGYPLLLSPFAALAPGFLGLIAVAASHLLFLVGLVLLRRLGRPVLGEARSQRAALLLAIFPFSFVYSMAYSEGLFLVLTVTACLMASARRPGWAGLGLAGAALTRLAAVGYFVPVGLLLTGFGLSRQAARRASPLLLAPLATLAYVIGFAALLTGHLDGWFSAQAGWGRATVSGTASGAGGPSIGASLGGPLGLYLGSLVALLVVAVLLVYWSARRDRLPPAYLVAAAGAIALSFLSGNLEAFGRLVLLAFPFAFILACREGFFWRRIWPALSLVGLFGVSLLAFAGWWVP